MSVASRFPSAFSFRGHTALFGGSFNPPHLGHMEAVKGLFKDPEVTRVILLPSFGTPLKNVGVSFDQRFEMTRIAFEPLLSNEKIELSAYEKENRLAYTWEVLEKLGRQIPKLAFVIGTDQFAKLSAWSRYPDVMSLCDWIVLLRRPDQLQDFEAVIRNYVSQRWLTPTSNEYEFLVKNTRRLRFVETEASAVSSSEIRRKLELGKTEEVKSLVPSSVCDFIERNKLYGT